MRVLSYDENGMADEVLMGVGEAYADTVIEPEEIERHTAAAEAAAEIQALTHAEMRDEAVFNDNQPWVKYNKIKTRALAETE